jgi:hypothetical protein
MSRCRTETARLSSCCWAPRCRPRPGSRTLRSVRFRIGVHGIWTDPPVSTEAAPGDRNEPDRKRVTAWRCLTYDVRVLTSYSRRKGDYAYDIEVHEVPRSVNADRRFCAVVVNMVRRTSGQIVSVNAGLEGAYGATVDEAVSRIEAAMEALVMATRDPRQVPLPTSHQIPHTTLDRDNEAQRFARIKHTLEELCVKMEDLHALATLAQHRAERQVADTTTLTDRALHRKRLDKKRCHH